MCKERWSRRKRVCQLTFLQYEHLSTWQTRSKRLKGTPSCGPRSLFDWKDESKAEVPRAWWQHSGSFKHCCKDFGCSTDVDCPTSMCHFVIEDGKPGAMFMSRKRERAVRVSMPLDERGKTGRSAGVGDWRAWWPTACWQGWRWPKEHHGRSVLRCEATDQRTLSHEEQHPPDRHMWVPTKRDKAAAEVRDGRAESVLVCLHTTRSVEPVFGQRPEPRQVLGRFISTRRVRSYSRMTTLPQVAVQRGMSGRASPDTTSVSENTCVWYLYFSGRCQVTLEYVRMLWKALLRSVPALWITDDEGTVKQVGDGVVCWPTWSGRISAVRVRQRRLHDYEPLDLQFLRRNKEDPSNGSEGVPGIDEWAHRIMPLLGISEASESLPSWDSPPGTAGPLSTRRHSRGNWNQGSLNCETVGKFFWYRFKFTKFDFFELINWISFNIKETY